MKPLRAAWAALSVAGSLVAAAPSSAQVAYAGQGRGMLLVDHRDYHGDYFGRRLARDDSGFFADPAAFAASPGRAWYDYDRGYPYDHYDDRAEAEPWPTPPGPRCEMEWTWDGRERRDVPVRVCRR